MAARLRLDEIMIHMTLKTKYDDNKIDAQLKPILKQYSRPCRHLYVQDIVDVYKAQSEATDDYKRKR